MADRRLRPAAWDPCAPCWGLFGLRLPAVRWGARVRGAGTTGGRSCEGPLTRPCCGPLAEGQLRGPEHLAWARGPWAGVTVSGGIALLRGARSGKGPSRSPPVLTALLRARGRLPARALSGGQAVDVGGGAGPPCGGEGGRLPAVGAGRPRVCRLQTLEAGRVVDSPTPMLPWSRAPAWTKPPAARSLHEACRRPWHPGARDSTAALGSGPLKQGRRRRKAWTFRNAAPDRRRPRPCLQSAPARSAADGRCRAALCPSLGTRRKTDLGFADQLQQLANAHTRDRGAPSPSAASPHPVGTGPVGRTWQVG